MIMDVTPNQAFDTSLEAARQKPRQKLRAADIKRLLKLAGKRPTPPQVTQIGALISDPTTSPSLVFELLGGLALAPESASRLSLLKPVLADTANTWLSAPPPPSQDLPLALDWLRSQLGTSPELPAINVNRARAVLLWLAAQYRNPEFFLQCLREVGSLLKPTPKRATKKPQPFRPGAPSGFVMAKLAQSLVAIGRGSKPKFGKLGQTTAVIESTLEHVRERTMAAEQALSKQAETDAALAEQQRTNAQHEETIKTLQETNKKLQAQVNSLTQQVGNVSQAHQQSIDHTTAQVAEAKGALLADIRSHLDPKLTDAKLYLDRPAPVVPQALRLLAEIAEILKSKEVNS
jgi:hypothetical protein